VLLREHPQIARRALLDALCRRPSTNLRDRLVPLRFPWRPSASGKKKKKRKEKKRETKT
jgi:hypothetical protein